jgi:hypothetical protein
MSWVKYVVRQYGFYLLKGLKYNKDSPFVRKELGILTTGLFVVYFIGMAIKLR